MEATRHVVNWNVHVTRHCFNEGSCASFEAMSYGPGTPTCCFSPLCGKPGMTSSAVKFNRLLLSISIISLGAVLLLTSNGRGRWTCSHTPNADGGVPLTPKFTVASEDTLYSKWHRDALSNLTLFRESLFPTVVQHGSWARPFTAKEDWPMFKPAVGCPPGRPLTRYPDVPGDGPKLLCQLNEEALPQEECLIYSLGSHGEPAASSSPRSAAATG